MHLTIAYITNRMNPRAEWFFDSLARETGGDYTGIKVVMVDHHFGKPLRKPQCKLPPDFKHTAPMGNVWNGPHRLTKQDWFAAANARNTALLLAPDGYLAYVDDLSVLLPGWLRAVREAMAEGYIALGSYKKMKNLVVEKGQVLSYEDYPPGVDTRLAILGKPGQAVPCGGDRMFGCSVAIHTEALLQVGGWFVNADGQGGEDYLTGMMCEKHGHRFKYDTRMATYESEEAHGEDPPFKRVIEKKDGRPDASHVLLNMVRNPKYTTEPGYWDGGIRAVRQAVLAGGPLPVIANPRHSWYSGKPLEEMS